MPQKRLTGRAVGLFMLIRELRLLRKDGGKRLGAHHNLEPVILFQIYTAPVLVCRRAAEPATELGHKEIGRVGDTTFNVTSTVSVLPEGALRMPNFWLRFFRVKAVCVIPFLDP